MTNLERLKMEIKGIDFPINELEIYLVENDLQHDAEYEPTSNTNKKNIYKTAVSILEGIANNPKLMKNYKTEDVTTTHFHTNLLNQIDNLNRKIRNMVDDDLNAENDAKFIYLFK